MSGSPSIYIVEDDIITQSQIRGYLTKVGYAIAGKSKNAEKALEEIRVLTVDMVILDINLQGEKDGLWLAQKLKKELDIPFIFLTAHNDKETIQTASETEPNGYLIKPFQEMDLYSAIEVGLKHYSASHRVIQDDIVIHDSIFIKEESLLVKIKFQDILYIMSEGNYLELHLSQKKHLMRNKLSDFIALLPPSMFVRTHQRFVINLHKVDAIGSATVQIANKEIPVSKSHKEALINKIKTA